MRLRIHTIKIMFFIVALILSFVGCENNENTVTVYTSVDRNYSEQVFNDFESKTGIRVLAVYDTEANKTTGMVNRLIEEQKIPVADVFWNSEFAQTILLKEKGVLAPYISEEAQDISLQYKDEAGYWSAFGGRARCILVNTDLVQPDDYPTGFDDFLDDHYDRSKIGMAYPLFGTTATHAAALYALMGDERATEFYQSIYEGGIRIVDGNGAVRDLVADGQLIFGFTDTDDALIAINKGQPVKMILPDQKQGQKGTLIIPNTVAMVKGAVNTDNAKVFIDYLLSNETEQYLMEIGWSQVSERATEEALGYLDMTNIKTLEVSLVEVYEEIEKAKEMLQKVFLR